MEHGAGPGIRVAADTLSARAAAVLADGPLDAVTLMRAVCRLGAVRSDAAQRMARALLSGDPAFEERAGACWALRTAPQTGTSPGTDPVGGAEGQGPGALLRGHFAVVDVETTGTRAGMGDRITEIAVVPVSDGHVGSPWVRLVHPDRPIPSMITALTGITNAMVAEAPRFRDVADEVVAQLRGRVFVAHNAGFDWRFVTAEVERARGLRLDGPRLCTVRLARAFAPELPRRSLDQATRHFGIAIAERHRAAGDAVATAELLVALLRRAADHGIDSWSALEQRLGGTGSARRRLGRPSRPFPPYPPA